MASPIDLHCDRCTSGASALRLSVTETVWYLLDVTPEGLYPDQPESVGEPIVQVVCLDCGHQGALRPEMRALLRLE